MPDDIVTEIWKPCFDGYYSISNLGRLRRERSAAGTRIGRLVKLTRQKRNGYLYAGVSVNTKKSNWRVHRLAALAFLEPRPIGQQINHKNGIKTDNRIVNLEWVTATENMRHARDTLGFNCGTKNRGEGNGRAKLKAEQVRQIRAIYASTTTTQIDLAKRFQVSAMTISEIVRGKHWSFLETDNGSNSTPDRGEGFAAAASPTYATCGIESRGESASATGD